MGAFDPTPVTNWLLLALAIGGLISMLYGIIVKANRAQERRIQRMIDVATRPIQPEANGGYSMSDLHTKVDELSVDLRRHINNSNIHMQEGSR